jgi:aminoglycoside phosphotransferase (APT) family kinase protein
VKAGVLERVGYAWMDWDVPGSPPTTALFAGVDRTAEAKVSVLLFDDQCRLVAVAKVPRNDRGAAAVRAEFEALSWAGSLEALAPTIPRPLGCFDLDGLPVLVQSAVTGRPMTADYYTPSHASRPWSVERDFERAAQWLDTFKSATRSGTIPLAAACERFVEPLLTRYATTLDTSDDELKLFDEVLDRCQLSGTMPVPITACHGDYWMGNILADGDRVTGVIDWERATRHAHPFSDLYKFPTSYGLYLDRPRPWAGGRVPGHPGREDATGRWRRHGTWQNLIGFGHVWFGSGWLPELVRSWVLARWAALDVDAVVAATFFPLFMAEQALVFDDPVTRAGWQSALRAFAAERENSWMW